MDNQLFRKKSIDRVSSPEQLNDYVRVSNPGVWMVLAGIIILLAGVCVWGIFGHLDTRITTASVVTDGQAVCYVRESDAASVKVGQTVRINGKECTVGAVSETPTAVSDELGDYALHLGSLSVGEWVYEVTFEAAELADGIYGADITVDSVSPISFIFN